MATKIQIKNGDEVILPLANTDYELVLSSPSYGQYPSFIAAIEVKTDGGNGIQFASGEVVNANSNVFISGEKLVMSFIPSISNLFVKSGDINNSFTITW